MFVSFTTLQHATQLLPLLERSPNNLIVIRQVWVVNFDFEFRLISSLIDKY
ncbi:hypothetical protein AHAS_Ahas01G0039700 [Arachis hypogaea]